MASLRVLHVIPSVSPRDGGPSRAIEIIERALCKAGVKVTTLTTDHDLDQVAGRTFLGSSEVPEPAKRIYAHKWLHTYKIAPGLVPQLVGAIRQHDVVHIHALFSFASSAAAWIARRQNVPYIVRPLGALSRYGIKARRPWLKRISMALIERRILQHAAAVHFTSAAERDEAESLGMLMRSVVIPLGVEYAEASSTSTVSDSVITGRQVILFLSRLAPVKNLEALIDAIACAPSLRSQSILIVAGSGEAAYVAGLKARVAAAGLNDQVVWLGHVEDIQKRAAFAAADVFVLPSFSENFGLAAVEAMLAGLPCLLGEGVAVAHGAKKADAAIVVKPEAATIATALLAILDCEQERKRLGERARIYAREELSASAMAGRLVELYRTVSVDFRNGGR